MCGCNIDGKGIKINIEGHVQSYRPTCCKPAISTTLLPWNSHAAIQTDMQQLQDIRKTYPKVVSDFWRNFSDINTCVQYVCMLEIRNVSDFSSQCFGYHISDIASDIRKAFWIYYDASPKHFSFEII